MCHYTVPLHIHPSPPAVFLFSSLCSPLPYLPVLCYTMLTSQDSALPVMIPLPVSWQLQPPFPNTHAHTEHRFTSGICIWEKTCSLFSICLFHLTVISSCIQFLKTWLHFSLWLHKTRKDLLLFFFLRSSLFSFLFLLTILFLPYFFPTNIFLH